MTQLPGTIGVVATNGFVPGIIRLGTRSHFDHVVIAVGEGRIVEAMPGGVRVRFEDEYDDIGWATTEPLDPAARAVMASTALAAIGTAYNWPAIAVFTVRTFASWLPHRRLSRWADNRDAVICSELAVRCMRAAGIESFGGRPAATVSPADFANLILSKGW